ncbi:MAG: ATP-binding cassette domain-containing protein, partial [Pseudomonadota bacterium]
VVDGLGGDDVPGLDAVSFQLAGGEILGVAGIAGNGQNALLAAMTGEAPAQRSETILFDGQPVGRLGPEARRAMGLRGVPEERNGHAAVGALSLTENALLTGRGRFAARGVVDFAEAARFAGEVIARFKVKATGATARAGGLSGGNLQRFVVGREILSQPKALVIDQPTWGVDAGAAAAIHQALLDLAADGAAILLISQDLDELLALCHRLAVIQGGRLSAAFDNDAAAKGKIGLLMGDAGPEQADAA